MANRTIMIAAATFATGVAAGLFTHALRPAAAPSPAALEVGVTTRTSAPGRAPAAQPDDARLIQRVMANDQASLFTAAVSTAATASADELATIIGQLGSVPNSTSRQEVLGVLVRRLTELSPQRALAAIEDLAPASRASLTIAAFARWGQIAPEAATRAMQRQPTGQQRRAAILGLLEGLRGRSALQQAVLDSAPSEYLPGALLAEDVGRHAYSDPEAAYARVASMPTAQSRSTALNWVIRAWARSDPAAALEVAQGVTPRDTRELVIGRLFAQWLRDDPPAAVTAIKSTPQITFTGSVRSMAIGALVEHDPYAAMDLVSQLTGLQRNAGYAQLFEHWLAQDPEAALEEFGALPQGITNDHNLQMMLARGYARSAPQDALQWLVSLQSTGIQANRPSELLTTGGTGVLGQITRNAQGSLRQSANQVAQVVAQAMPYRTLEAARGIRDPDWRNEVRRYALDHWLREDAYAALAWVDGLPEDEYQETVAAMGASVAAHDLQAGAEFALRARGPARETLIRSVTDQYATGDTQAALAWIEQHRQEPFYQTLLGDVVKKTARRLPDQALALASQMPDGPERHRAMARVVTHLADQDPARAAGLVESLAPGSDRVRAMSFIASRWVSHSPSAALAWARDLSPAQTRGQAMRSVLGTGAVPPEQALSSVRSLEAEVERFQAAQTYVYATAKTDVDAAAAFLAASEDLYTDSQARALHDVVGRYRARGQR